MNETTLPSEKAKQKALAEQERIEAKEKALGELRGACQRIAQTQDGKILFRWLKHECGFGESIMGANPLSGDIDEKRTLYSAMRLNLYITIRKFLSPKIIMEIEHV